MHGARARRTRGMRTRKAIRSVTTLRLVWAATHVTIRQAHAQWVRGEVALDGRPGRGRDRKIISSIATGDRVSVLENGDGGTLVRIQDGQEGWIPGGFLADQPPAAV